jgi:hypothetical protein
MRKGEFHLKRDKNKKMLGELKSSPTFSFHFPSSLELGMWAGLSRLTSPA